jgi:hypothetical protein
MEKQGIVMDVWMKLFFTIPRASPPMMLETSTLLTLGTLLFEKSVLIQVMSQPLQGARI